MNGIGVIMETEEVRVQMQRTNNRSAKYLQRGLVRGEVEQRKRPAKTIWIAPLTKPLPDDFDC